MRQLDVPLNNDDMFVPGVRRGYAILPIVPKPFESEDDRRARVQTAIQRVRNANMSLGQKGLRKLWVAISQSPERRKRAKLAGKVKRAILEMGGTSRPWTSSLPPVRYGWGALRFCSATAKRPRDAQNAGVGWVDLKLLAKTMKKTLKDVEEAWGPREQELQ